MDPIDATLALLRQAEGLRELDLSDSFCECPSAFNEGLVLGLTPLSGLSCLNLAGTAVNGAALQSLCAALTVSPLACLYVACLGRSSVGLTMSRIAVPVIFLEVIYTFFTAGVRFPSHPFSSPFSSLLSFPLLCCACFKVFPL